MANTSVTIGLKFGENIRKIKLEPFSPTDITRTQIKNRIKNFNASAMNDEPFKSFKESVCDIDGTPFDKIASLEIEQSEVTEYDLS